VHKGLEFTRQETQENYFFMLNLQGYKVH